MILIKCTAGLMHRCGACTSLNKTAQHIFSQTVPDSMSKVFSGVPDSPPSHWTSDLTVTKPPPSDRHPAVIAANAPLFAALVISSSHTEEPKWRRHRAAKVARSVRRHVPVMVASRRTTSRPAAPRLSPLCCMTTRYRVPFVYRKVLPNARWDFLVLCFRMDPAVVAVPRMVLARGFSL